MKKSEKLTVYIVCMFLIVFLFVNKVNVQENIISSTEMFLRCIFPTLFPMFIIIDILISYNVPYYIDRYTSWFTKRFLGLSGSGSFIYIMSVLSGTPSNGFLVRNLVMEGSINSDDASRVLGLTLFNNPLFLYSMLSLSFSEFGSLIIILSNYLASLIIAFITRRDSSEYFNKIRLNDCKFSNVFISSISKSMNVMLLILGTVVVFNMIDFNTGNIYLDMFIHSVMEITGGLNLLSRVGCSLLIKLCFAVLMVSFTGLCIQYQIKSILVDTSINYKKFYKYRIAHLIALFGLSILFFFIFPKAFTYVS